MFVFNMVWITAAMVVFLACFCVVKYFQRKKLLQKLERISGPSPLPIVGNLIEICVDMRGFLKLIKRWNEKFGARYKVFLGMSPYVVLSNASDTEKLLGSNLQIDKSSDYDLLHPWLGQGLLTSRGEKWFHRRKQLTSTFHFKILEDFMGVFNEQCYTLQNVLESKGDQCFDILSVITYCALDIICETACGRRLGIQKQSDSPYVKAICRLSQLVRYRQLRPWLHSQMLWKLSQAGREEADCLETVHSFTDSVIRERKMERKETIMKNGNVTKEESYSKKRLAFLDLLLEAQETDENLTATNIREETDTFMFEGHDTVSAATSWTIFLLSCHPEYQAKVHEELDEIFSDDRTRPVTMADLTRMKYLECCIKEGLRLYPSVPCIGRKIATDLKLEDGAIVPVGCTVLVFIYFLHRDAKIFPDPEKFIPERFLYENSKGRHAFSYVPFSAGPRNCIGQKYAMMEEKVIISSIFRNFHVTAMKKWEDVKLRCELILRPYGGLPVSLRKRQ